MAITRWAPALALVLCHAGLVRADDRAAADKLALPLAKSKPYLGLAIGITRPEGQQIYGYGQVLLHGKMQTPGPDTVFEIGSITKTFTGTLLADLVARGMVRLDDPAQKYLPASLKLPRRDDRDITLLHLATHSSSLPSVTPAMLLIPVFRGKARDPYDAVTWADVGKDLATMKLSRPIGSRCEYSNLGVGLLGNAIVHAARTKSYEDVLRTRITGPLRMSDTSTSLSPSQRKRFPPCYASDGKETPAWTFACLEGCGALHSTVHDLLIYAEANLGRRKTALDSALQMAQQPWRDRNQADQYVGLCWMRQPVAKGQYTLIWHNGGTFGSHSWLGFVPEKGIGVVVLCNADTNVDSIGMRLLETLLKKNGAAPESSND